MFRDQNSQRILIIGNGPWGQKVADSLTNRLGVADVQIVTSRNLIERGDLKTYEKPHSIWIASQPNLQLAILKTLMNESNHFILEKPFATEYQDIIEMYELTQNLHSNLFVMSSPWVFSDIWSAVKAQILGVGLKHLTIKTFRGGPLLRPNISPVKDWIPHDICLLTDLLGNHLHPDNIELLGSAGGTASFRFNLDSLRSCVMLECGQFSERVATWEVSWPDHSMTVDFLNSRLVFDNGSLLVNSLDSLDNISRNYLATDAYFKQLTGQNLVIQSYLFAQLPSDN